MTYLLTLVASGGLERGSYMFGRQMAYAGNENCADESGSNNNFYWIP